MFANDGKQISLMQSLIGKTSNDQNYIFSLGLQDANWLNPPVLAKAMPKLCNCIRG